MSELKIEVFTSRTCPHCPSAVRATKQLLEENPSLKGRVKWSEVSTSTPKGGRRASTYQIRSVPTIILTNKNGEKGAYPGTPSQEKYLKMVYEMLGEELPEKLKGKSDGLLGGIGRLFQR